MAAAVPDPRRWKALAVLGVAYLMVILDVSIVNVALPSMQKDLGFAPENLQWVLSGYALLLGPVDGVEPPLADDADHRRSWFVYPVTLARGIDRERVIEALAAEGIATSRYLPSIHLQPYMRERFGYREGMLPVAEDASRRTLALPFFPQLGEEDQRKVVDALRRAVENGDVRPSSE